MSSQWLHTMNPERACQLLSSTFTPFSQSKSVLRQEKLLLSLDKAMKENINIHAWKSRKCHPKTLQEALVWGGSSRTITPPTVASSSRIPSSGARFLTHPDGPWKQKTQGWGYREQKETHLRYSRFNYLFRKSESIYPH